MSQAIDDVCEPIACVDTPINDPPSVTDYFRSSLSTPLVVDTLEDLREVSPSIDKAVICLEDGADGIYKIRAGTSSTGVLLNTPGYYGQRISPAKAAETYINIRNHGGGTGVDDDAKIARELSGANPSCTVYFPNGEYRGDTTIEAPDGNGCRIKGESRESAILNIYEDRVTGIRFDRIDAYGVGVEDLFVRGWGNRTAGYGIDIPTFVRNSYVRNVKLEGHYDGLGLGPTDLSYFDHVISHRNYRSGIHLRNRDGLPASSVQWTGYNNLCQLNDGSGFFYEGVKAAGRSQMTTGTLTGCMSFANSRYGIEAAGRPDMKIQGIRLNFCFTGEDALACLYLDTYGEQHIITGGSFEIAGKSKTGRSYTTPPTNFGVGIQLTENNKSCTLTGANINGNALDGILTYADKLSVSGCSITNNGTGFFPGRRNGIYHLRGKLVVSGGIIENNNSAIQQYGVNSFDGAYLKMTGVEMDDNAIANYFIAINTALAKISNC